MFLLDAIIPEIKYTKINIEFLETFDVKFGKEEDCVTLSCKMTISPNLANLQPEAQWYRDGTKHQTLFTHIVVMKKIIQHLKCTHLSGSLTVVTTDSTLKGLKV